MSQKVFHVYACRITVDGANGNSPLFGEDLMNFLNAIKLLPIDLSVGNNSRYKKNSTCLIFIDELKSNINIRNDFLSAIYIKRRDNKPLEDDGHGKLQTITLASDENQIAEVCYVIFSFKRGILYWIGNPLVSGSNSFAEYLNFTYRKSCYLKKSENNFLPNISQVILSYIKYPNSESDYKKESFLPIGLDFNLALGKKELGQGHLFGDSDGAGIELIKHFAVNSNCGKIHIEISAPPYRKKKNEESSRPYLNKMFISNFFDNVKWYLGKNDRDKFSVRGVDIDDDAKVLDLINSRWIIPLSIDYNTSSLSVTEILFDFEKLVRSINSKIEETL